MQKGGIYKVDGKWVDANGKEVDAPKQEKSTVAEKQPEPPAYPDNFPGRTVLEKAGVKSAADAQKLTREALIEIRGIGADTADAILSYKV